MPVVAAYPFIEVKIDTSALTPVARREPGVIAVVGKTPAGANGGTADVNKPYVIDTAKDAADLFAKVANDGTVTETDLYKSLKIALLQDPKPSNIYGVRVAADNYAAALNSIEALDDVTFVSLANEKSVGVAAAGNVAASGLMALKDHVETMSASGYKRIGVAMVDPATVKSNTYVTDVSAAVATLKSSVSRMVLIAARGAVGDSATASMAAMAGYKPHISLVLKKIKGITIAKEKQYSPSEIKGLSEAGLIPIIDPSLIVGESLHFAEGRCFTSDASLLYVDIVRTLDDIEFRLKAGLIGLIGDARITKSGLTLVKGRVDAILGVLKRDAVIDDYSIQIPVLDILSLPETVWSGAEKIVVTTARANREVDIMLSVTYGPAVHRLKVTLLPKY